MHADAVAVQCVIVDDSFGFLEAARALLEREGLAVVGVAATRSDAVRCVGELRPEVVLVDIDLGGDSGFEVARRIVDVAPTTVILISTHAEDDFADLIAESPAAGFISKSELSAEAIHEFLGGPSDDGAGAARQGSPRTAGPE
ncbi:MAG: putative transcriptional regulator [Solirubrobacterales bacterium]|jgi:DNA-binding NarL/FixJ family response regulator|nr:putative transcriptional regulator [Solirubrobacterales bacterium]